MAASGKDGGGGGGGRLKAFHRNHAGLTDIPRDIPPHSGVINLSKNKISILRAGRLRNFTNCQALDLSYNNIALIEPGSFEGLGSVKNPLRLFLSNNYLENSIRSEMWKGLKNVLRLEVAFNKITHLRRGMFLSLAEAKLKELNLGANNILQIAEGSFAGLSTLRFLRLSDNQLKHLKPSMFSGLEMIMYLFLEENKISLIGEGTFANLKSLHRLCLTGNKLKSLNGLAFNHPTRHLQLELRENPLECSERLCWIKKSLSGGHVEKIDKAECNTLKDKKLVKSHLAEQCPEPGQCWVVLLVLSTS